MALGMAAAVAGAQFASAADTPKPAAQPKAAASQTVEKTMKVTTSFDGGNRRFVAGRGVGDGGQNENQKPMFEFSAAYRKCSLRSL